jgi:hypothetical protein
MLTKAVIVVQPDKFTASAARCLDYCAAMRYEVAGLINGDWAAARRMVGDGLAEVIVVPSLAGLDPDNEPRVEVAPKRTPNTRRPAGRFRAPSRATAR